MDTEDIKLVTTGDYVFYKDLANNMILYLVLTEPEDTFSAKEFEIAEVGTSGNSERKPFRSTMHRLTGDKDRRIYRSWIQAEDKVILDDSITGTVTKLKQVGKHKTKVVITDDAGIRHTIDFKDALKRIDFIQ